MAGRQDTLWESFLKPIARVFIDEDSLRQLYESIDWEREVERFRAADLVYPEYYATQNFHGIDGGYLNTGAPVSYDPVTQYVLPPNETWVRQEAIAAIGGQPRTIVDLGCGTGSTTLMLKQAFMQAEVLGVDLSPYMLVMADYKAKQAQLDMRLQHGLAEDTGLPAASFDVAVASLLFHETPPEISQAILRECFRLLVPGGQIVILDGNQNTLRQTDWLTTIFEEPYIKDYAAGSIDAWMGAAGFQGVQTEEKWWVHQVTRGIKPIAAGEKMEFQEPQATELGTPGIPEPAF